MSLNTNAEDSTTASKEKEENKTIEDQYYSIPNEITSENYTPIFMWLNGAESNCAFKFNVNDPKTLNVQSFKREIEAHISSTPEIKRRLSKNISSQGKIVHLYTIKEMDLEDGDIRYLKENDVIFFTFDNSGFKSSNHFFLYKFEGWIKSGGYGKVFLARNILTKEEVAVKQIDTSNYSNEEMYNLSREHLILRNMIHKNVIKCVDFFAYDNKFYTVMDYAAGGELTYLLEERGRMSEAEAKVIFKQIYNAVYFIHSKNIIHRDLKPNNILFLDKERTKVVLIDFGISGFSNGNQKDTIKAGTIRFMPPEVVSGSNFQSSAKMDVWALGVILYKMVLGTYPFDGKSTKEIVNKILDDKMEFNKKIKISPQLKELIEGMLTKSIRFRIDMESDLFTNWFESECSNFERSEKKKSTMMRLINGLEDINVKKAQNARKISLNVRNSPASPNESEEFDTHKNTINTAANDPLSVRKTVSKKEEFSGGGGTRLRRKMSSDAEEKIEKKKLKPIYKSDKRLNIVVKNKGEKGDKEDKSDKRENKYGRSSKNLEDKKVMVRNKNSVNYSGFNNWVSNLYASSPKKHVSDFNKDIQAFSQYNNKPKFYGKSPQKSRCKIQLENPNYKNNDIILPLINTRGSLGSNSNYANKKLGRLKSTC